MLNFSEYLNESSLSRIWRHVQDHQAGAISGYRDGNSKSENRRNNQEISAFLRSRGYSVTGVQGNYIENFGSDNQKEVGEPSFFVVDIADKGTLERDLRALGERFDQDSILVVPQGGKNAYLVGTSKRDDAFPDYGQKVKVGSGRFGKVAGQFLSRIRGREFTFESVDDPQTINGKWAMSKIAEQVESDLIKKGLL